MRRNEYEARIEYVDEDRRFYGYVLLANGDGFQFDGESVQELEAAFDDQVRFFENQRAQRDGAAG